MDRQTLFFFGNANGAIISSVVMIRNNGEVTFTNSENINKGSMDSSGNLTIELSRVAYDNFLIMSPERIS